MIGAYSVPLLRPAKRDTVYLIEVPVEGGGRLLVQASEAELPGDLQLAAARPGEVVVTKGTSEMHFGVTLSWKRPGSAAGGD